jgi:hypothetical protein
MRIILIFLIRVFARILDPKLFLIVLVNDLIDVHLVINKLFVLLGLINKLLWI